MYKSTFWVDPKFKKKKKEEGGMSLWRALSNVWGIHIISAEITREM